MTGLVIDCHGHFTSEPVSFRDYRRAQIARSSGGSRPGQYEGVDDAELTQIILENQLRVQQERGTDVTVLSPRASGMGHHVSGTETAVDWARLSNDTIARICELFPDNFAPACQLPQTTEDDLSASIAELERCVAAGFVACNLNPDPSGGYWNSPPLTDRWWDPLWEAMEHLRVPAMIHASASCLPPVHTTGAHYLAADTSVFMQLVAGDLFERHPDLLLIIPHGGGAVPYHWGRYRGLAIAMGKPDLGEHLMQNVFFDTCVYHQPGINLLFDVIDHENILFGSELLGAVTVDDPESGHPFDDTKRYIDALALDKAAQESVFELNARRVYPRLDERLAARGR